MRHVALVVLLLVPALLAGCAEPGEPGPSGGGVPSRFTAMDLPFAGNVAAVADLDEDGRHELITLSDGTIAWGRPGEAPNRVECAACQPRAAAVARFEQSGPPVLVVLDADGLRFHAFTNRTFQPMATPEEVAGMRGATLVVADFDNDARLDVLVAGASGTQVGFGSASGFEPPVALLSGAQVAAAFHADDDMLLDVVLADASGLRLWRNGGGDNRTYTEVPLPVGLASVRSIQPLDYDNDQRLDLLLAREGGLALLRNMGGRWEDESARLPSVNPVAALAADFDNDGWLDIAALESDALVVARSVEKADRFETASRTALGAADLTTMALFDITGDGRLDLGGISAEGPGRAFANALEAGHYFTVAPVGNQSNAAGIGVKVTLTTTRSIQLQQPGGLGSPTLALPAEAHFGLGPDSAPRYALALLWPSGILQFDQAEADLIVDMRLVARESESESPWDTC